MKTPKLLFILFILALLAFGAWYGLNQSSSELPPSDPGTTLESAAPVVPEAEIEKAGF